MRALMDSSNRAEPIRLKHANLTISVFRMVAFPDDGTDWRRTL